MTPAQQKEYMSTYIKNQEGGYPIKQLRSLSFEQVKEIFETTMRKVQYFVPMDSELEVQRLKRAGQEVLEEPDLVKERFSTIEPTDDKEKELWVELKRLFEPDDDDTLWKLQRYMHDPLVWRLYDTCGAHHVSSLSWIYPTQLSFNKLSKICSKGINTIQLSIAEQKSRNDLEAKQNEEKVKEHLIAEEIGKWWKEHRIGLEELLPNMVDDRVKELTKTQVLLYVAEGLILERKQNQADVAKMIADAIQQEGENLQAEITLQINNAITNHIPFQVDSSIRSSAIRPKSSFSQANESEPGPSTSGNQEQLDGFDFWTDTYATTDDELPAEKVSQELVEEMP
ncbi:hypothetical protein Tco_1517318 [Tanacetum coccineum]